MSVCTSALQPAMISVIDPIVATMDMATGENSNTVCMRAMRYTPEVTIVAACISALTGEGPAMASGSHDCSGNCADLPTAPPTSSIAMTVILSSPSLKC